jgi:hypothetical protein
MFIRVRPTVAKFQMFFALTVLVSLLVSGCGPAPNPKLQAKPADSTHEAQKPAEAPVEKPVAAGPEEPVQPAVVARPTPKPAVRQAAPARVPQRPAPAATASASSEDNRVLAAPRTLNLPAPITPPLAEALPPADEVAPEPVAPPPPPAPRRMRVPSGTIVGVRMIDAVDSETAQVGETFKASLDEPIVLDDETIFPEGAEVYVKLSKVQSAGRVSGKSEIQLELDRIFLGSKSYVLESSKYVSTGASQTGRTARSAGLGAAIGAAIGAISGGGKGAVIGGATGAGAGAGVEAIRKGEQVRVDSETRLDFRLEESVEVILQSASPTSHQRNNPSGPVRFGTRP